MAQNINDNLRLHAPKLLDDKAGPYASVAAALAGIPAYQRCPGLEVVVEVGGVQKKYWFDGGVADVDLVEIPSGGSGGYEPKNSIEVDADELQLVGDEASPGNSKYYGTDGAGAKGFHDLPAGGGAGLPPFSPDATTRYSNGLVKRLYVTYPDSKFKDSRFEYDVDGYLTKLEIQDTFRGEFVRKTPSWTDGKYNGSTVTTITEFTITI